MQAGRPESFLETIAQAPPGEATLCAVRAPEALRGLWTQRAVFARPTSEEPHRRIAGFSPSPVKSHFRVRLT